MVEIRTRKTLLAVGETRMAVLYSGLLQALTEGHLSGLGSQRRGLDFLRPQYPTEGTCSSSCSGGSAVDVGSSSCCSRSSNSSNSRNMNFYFVAVCVAIDSTEVRTNRTCAKAFRINSPNELVYRISCWSPI